VSVLHQWLRQGYQANVDFKMAQEIINQGFHNIEEKNTRSQNPATDKATSSAK
jgi:hypothetical protein